MGKIVAAEKDVEKKLGAANRTIKMGKNMNQQYMYFRNKASVQKQLLIPKIIFASSYDLMASTSILSMCNTSRCLRSH